MLELKDDIAVATAHSLVEVVAPCFRPEELINIREGFFPRILAALERYERQLWRRLGQNPAETDVNRWKLLTVTGGIAMLATCMVAIGYDATHANGFDEWQFDAARLIPVVAMIGLLAGAIGPYAWRWRRGYLGAEAQWRQEYAESQAEQQSIPLAQQNS